MDKNFYYAERMSKLIQIETVSDYNNRENENFAVLRQELKVLFPKIFEVCTYEEFEGGILLKWAGKSSENPVLFMNHHDVVSATGEWKYPPFSGAIEEGKLWGRGTLDTKGGLFCMLQSAEELLEEGFVPETDIYFESACTEETDGIGCDKISLVLQERGIRFALVMDEGGMMIPDPFGLTKEGSCFAMVGVGEKGRADLKFVAHSHGGHASTPPKDTPLVRLGKFMAEAEKGKVFRSKLSPVLLGTLQGVATKVKSAPLRFILKHASWFKPLLEKIVPALSLQAGALFKTTLAFTTAKGSNGLNVIPETAFVTGNMRFSHHQGSAGSIKAISALAKKYDVETEVIDEGIESGISDYKGEQFAFLKKHIEKCFPNAVAVPYIMTGASDSRFLSRICDNVFRFVPFTVTIEQLSSIHGLNECVDIINLEPAVNFYKELMQDVTK